MLPKTASEFGTALRALGVRQSKPVVVYSRGGFFGSARAWWMFRLYGKDDVAVLDGGFSEWEAAGLPTQSGPPGAAAVPPDEHDAFVPEHRPALVRNMRQMLDHLTARDATVMDARNATRFAEHGRMPGAINLPYRDVLDDAGKMKTLEELRDVLAQRGVPLGVEGDKQLVATCGSGVTACTVALGVFVAEGKDVAVYDGSWTEYSSEADNPVEKGPLN